MVVETTSTGIALLFSKLLPYALAFCLSLWTLGYGEHEKKKAVRLAAATQDVVAAATHDPRPAATQDPEPPPALSADAEWCGPGR